MRAPVVAVRDLLDGTSLQRSVNPESSESSLHGASQLMAMHRTGRCALAEIGVVGCGHVGLVAAASFAALGHHVIGIDTDRAKIELLRNGECPITEPKLDELLRAGL